jgi:hypothetical protein
VPLIAVERHRSVVHPDRFALLPLSVAVAVGEGGEVLVERAFHREGEDSPGREFKPVAGEDLVVGAVPLDHRHAYRDLEVVGILDHAGDPVVVLERLQVRGEMAEVRAAGERGNGEQQEMAGIHGSRGEVDGNGSGAWGFQPEHPPSVQPISIDPAGPGEIKAADPRVCFAG